MIVHAFISRNADFILEQHLRAYGSFCDRIVCVLDRSPQSEEICNRFPNVEVIRYSPTQDRPDNDANGIVCEEGKLRQLAWNIAASYSPEWIALGDTDEIPTPDVVDFARTMSPGIDVYCAHWVNLWQNVKQALGGANAKWSFQNPNANKKAIFARWRADVEYRYDLDKLCHSRLEPNATRAVIDDRHVLVESPKLIHYKYARPDWFRDPLRLAGGQYSTMESDATIVDVPDEWHWPNLPAEVIA